MISNAEQKGKKHEKYVSMVRVQNKVGTLNSKKFLEFQFQATSFLVSGFTFPPGDSPLVTWRRPPVILAPCRPHPSPVPCFSILSQEHVEGRLCDTCHHGYHTLERRNSLGCLPCACDSGGTVPGGRCDQRTGQCPCREGAEGLQCTDCAHNYYNNRSSQLQGKRPL